MAPSPVTAAEDKLRRWAEANAMRDEVVREAAAAGVSIHQIQQITGITRATIVGILARRPKRPLLRLVSSDEPSPHQRRPTSAD
jgi:CRP-like cAMP-binding protein